MIRKELSAKLFCYAVAIFYALFMLLPVWWMLSIALKTQLEAFSSPPLLIFKPKLLNISAVLADSTFRRGLVNSLVVAAGTVLLSMCLAIPASYGLSRIRGPLRRNALAWFLFVRTVPGMVYVLPYFIAYLRSGLIDTRIGLILVNVIFTTPLATWMMLSFFEELPQSVEEAALLDGATPFQTMLRIAIPLTTPGISATAILAFIFSWNEFLFALTLTRRFAKTTPVAIVNFMAYEGTEWGKVAAGGIFIMLPVLIFAILIRKYLVRGLVAGAVKE